MIDRIVSRSSRLASGEVAQVAVWAGVNILLGVVFTALLRFDDRIGRAIGF